MSKRKAEKVEEQARFVMEAGRVAIQARPWYVRQYTVEEAEAARSAGRIARNAITGNPRLRRAGPAQAVEQEARRAYADGYMEYVLPLLIEDEAGQPIFDVASDASLAEFEGLPDDVKAELIAAFWAIFNAEQSAKNSTGQDSEPSS